MPSRQLSHRCTLIGLIVLLAIVGRRAATQTVSVTSAHPAALGFAPCSHSAATGVFAKVNTIAPDVAIYGAFVVTKQHSPQAPEPVSSFGTAYNPAAFDAMPDFPDAKAALDVSDWDPLIAALGEVVMAHGLDNTVGVSLNHRHFTLAADEILVETMHGSSSEHRAIRQAEFAPATMVPCMWVFHDCQFRPVEFVTRGPTQLPHPGQHTRLCQQHPAGGAAPVECNRHLRSDHSPPQRHHGSKSAGRHNGDI